MLLQGCIYEFFFWGGGGGDTIAVQAYQGGQTLYMCQSHTINLIGGQMSCGGGEEGGVNTPPP